MTEFKAVVTVYFAVEDEDLVQRYLDGDNDAFYELSRTVHADLERGAYEIDWVEPV